MIEHCSLTCILILYMMIIGSDKMHEHRRHKREIKDPLERKKEILDKAMELFTIYGYEQTSMRDIARELNISLGLCYRYFDSKNVLFEEAMKGYIEECCQKFVSVLKDNHIDFEEKINVFVSLLEDEKNISRYHHFFHKPENKALHQQLSFQMCQYMYPYILEALNQYAIEKKVKIKNPEICVSFLTYGQIGLLSQHDMPDHHVIETLKHYIHIFLENEIIPDN